MLLTTTAAFPQFNPIPDSIRTAYHQFDFWLGEWDVYMYGTDQLVGKSHIMSINDSTALLENYTSTNADMPFSGKSVNTYNRKKGKWQQFWTDSWGTVLELEGGIKNGIMVLEATVDTTFNRITWEEIDNGAVRQIWTITSDGGDTWKTIYDGEYRKRK